jgi:hypothetical protein
VLGASGTLRAANQPRKILREELSQNATDLLCRSISIKQRFKNDKMHRAGFAFVQRPD